MSDDAAIPQLTDLLCKQGDPHSTRERGGQSIYMYPPLSKGRRGGV